MSEEEKADADDGRGAWRLLVAENPRRQCRYNLPVLNPLRATSESVSSKRNKFRSSRGHKPLTRALLLPMDRASANAQSLACHLALVACRSGHGNGHHVNELMRVVYLGWFLQRAGYGNCPAGQFKVVEY
ncbi:hypothetical protein GNZ13_49705, partial [Paraburkholderia sp. 5N]|nr:hypothetical protein [Paraburkholderia elongata]